MCEAVVEAAAEACGSCKHDLTSAGPITPSGHDVRQLKSVIREREDLSMAEKFSMIAQVEEGADPVELGIAAPAEPAATSGATPSPDEHGVTPTHLPPNNAAQPAISTRFTIGDHPSAASAADLVLGDGVEINKKSIDAIIAGSDAVNLGSTWLTQAFMIGIEAAHHVDDVACGHVSREGGGGFADIPDLTPPKRSFCGKCGSDILEQMKRQWEKWNELGGEVSNVQIEAAMQASVAAVLAHSNGAINRLKGDVELAKVPEIDPDALRAEIEAELRASLTKEIEEKMQDTHAKELEKLERKVEEASKVKPSPRKTSTQKTGKKEGEVGEKPKSATKKKSGAMFGSAPATPSKTYDGDPDDKTEWFLDEALDTVYDPHGTGKKLTRKTILARSGGGNVRVSDVVQAYAEGGKDAVSELAWSSPFTEYIIDAYDAC